MNKTAVFFLQLQIIAALVLEIKISAGLNSLQCICFLNIRVQGCGIDESFQIVIKSLTELFNVFGPVIQHWQGKLPEPSRRGETRVTSQGMPVLIQTRIECSGFLKNDTLAIMRLRQFRVDAQGLLQADKGLIKSVLLHINRSEHAKCPGGFRSQAYGCLHGGGSFPAAPQIAVCQAHVKSRLEITGIKAQCCLVGLDGLSQVILCGEGLS